MKNIVTEMDNWLANTETSTNERVDSTWEPGFDADRRLVISKVWIYKKFFLRPKKFIKRFYHTIAPLSIEEWRCTDQVKLYNGFCTLDITLSIRFQASFEYASNNIEILDDLNTHVKVTYQGMVLDIVNRELLNLSDGSWVQEGLKLVEQKISLLISEMLILHQIQSQVICTLRPSFEEFPDVQFAKENAYLYVLKRSFEFDTQQNETLFKQQQQQEKQKIEHKRKQFKHLNELAELDRQKHALHAENNKRLLEDKEFQQLEQFQLRKKIQVDKIRHHKKLKELTLIEALKEKEYKQILIRESEEKDKVNLISHKMKIKEKELNAEIATYEKEQVLWREAKSKSHAEEMDHKHHLKQLEFKADTDYKKRCELQRIAMQKESFSVRKNADLYLKREIDLLELEKKRLALQLTIKRYKNKEKEEVKGNNS